MSTPTLRDDLHRASLARFLQLDTAPDARVDEGLQRVFRTLFPVTVSDGLGVLEFVSYALEAPRYDEHECRRCGYTLAAAMKVTVRLILWDPPTDPGDPSTRQIRDIKEQEVYFGELPLTSRLGSFVVEQSDRAALLQLTRAPGVRHDTAPDGSPAVVITPRHGLPLTLWLDRQGALQGSLGDDLTFPGDRLCRAYGFEPSSMKACDDRHDAAELGRLLGPADTDDPEQWFDRAFRRGMSFDLSTLGRRALTAALGHDVPPEQLALDTRDLMAIVEVLHADRLLEERGASHHLRVAGDHLEDAVWKGLTDTLAKTRASMVKAASLDSLETLMPHDLLNAKPLGRAWRELLTKSPLIVALDDTNPLARVAQAWRVRLDDDALDAFFETPRARWITRDPRDPSRGDLALDAPVDALGVIDDAPGDARTLAARLVDAKGDARPEVLLRALPLEAPDALTACGEIAREIAARSGALVRATRAATVTSVTDRDVWTREDGTAEPLRYQRSPWCAPRVKTPFSLRSKVVAGQRVEAGDVIAEGASVASGTLALGRRCRVARAQERSPGTCHVSREAAAWFRAPRIEYVDAVARDTRQGVEHFEATVPGVDAHALRHLDASGLAALGAEVEVGDVLAGRVAPVGWSKGPNDEIVEEVSDCSVRSTVKGTVVSVEVFARKGRERSARHDAIVAAMAADLDEDLDAWRAFAEGLDEDAGGLCLDAARTQEAELRWRLDRGHDLPPGVVVYARFEVLVEKPLAPGDELASLDGARFTVTEIDDEPTRADVVLAGEGEGDEVYLVRLAPEAPTPAAKRQRAKKSAKKSSK
ncbi:MAG: hypothetical protein U0326_29795 [Polyangiales bacterium]